MSVAVNEISAGAALAPEQQVVLDEILNENKDRPAPRCWC
jgi:hypothetical protein